MSRPMSPGTGRVERRAVPSRPAIPSGDRRPYPGGEGPT